MSIFQSKTAETPATPRAETAPILPAEENVRMGDVTFITKSTVFEGTLRSESPIEMEGLVKGAIQCKADLNISGRMEGEITAGSLIAEHATILGDITCASGADILSGSQVQGNIRAQRVTVSACVKGDITAGESVVLESDAVVLGDITAKYVQTAKGAYVKGAVATTSALEQEKLFDRIDGAPAETKPESPRQAAEEAVPVG